MTAKDVDRTDDAEFEDFLLGKGELADLLRTLPQAAPSAELDAKILHDAEAALARTAHGGGGNAGGSGNTPPSEANTSTSTPSVDISPPPVTALPAIKPVAEAPVPLSATASRTAANDPAPHTSSPPIGFFSRWRMPLGLVATLLLSMSVTLKVWRGQDVRSTPPVLVADETARAGAETAAPAALPAPQASAPVKLAQAPAPPEGKGKLDDVLANPADKAAAPALAKERSAADAKAGPPPEFAKMQKKVKREPVADAPFVAAAPMAENRAAAPVMAEQAESRAAPVPMAAPVQRASGGMPENRGQENQEAPSRRAAAAYSRSESESSQTQINGTVMARRENRQDAAQNGQAGALYWSKPAAPVVAAPPPPPARAAAKVASSESAAPWLLRIEKWLKEGKQKAALDEWQKFRLAYPDYAVSAATLKQIEALQQPE